MGIRTGIALIFLAAFAFVAAEDGESKEGVIEQLVVETLVSWFKFFNFMNDYYYKSPRSRSLHACFYHKCMLTSQCKHALLHLF